MTSNTLSRRDDPVSSHDAAEQMQTSGNAEDHTRRIAAAIDATPGLTNKHLAGLLHLTNVQVCRRSPDLRKLGYESRAVTGMGSELRWFPASPKSQGELF